MFNEIFLKSKNDRLVVGSKTPVRVNCNVGITSDSDRAYEVERLVAIKKNKCFPDLFMDLSVGQYNKPFYKEIQSLFECPIGCVPSYMLPSDTVVKKETAIGIIRRLADDGISFLTLHLTASLELYKLAKTIRKIPITSRGGYSVLRQMKMTNGMNIWKTCLSDIIDIVKSYDIVVSLGIAFRPAGIGDACDEVHLKETNEQLNLCKVLQQEGVQVMVENVGHISLEKLEHHCDLLRQFKAPIMPLGPIPTDFAVNADHIASAIGASFMGYWGCAHIINSITCSEHSNSFFTINETLEAIRSAKLAAHIIDVARGINSENDDRIYEQRAKQHNCLAGTETDCRRCSIFCPLK